MGYAQTNPLSFLELGNAHTRLETTVSTVPGDWVFSPFSFLNYLSGRVHHAFIDAYFPYVHNSNAGANYAVAGKIRVAKFGGIYTDAISIGDETFYLGAGETGNMQRITGNYDIQTVINDCLTGASTMLVKWENATAHANNLLFRDAYCILRVTE
jgi:hypothetical protein